MRLKAISFVEHQGQPREWRLERSTFSSINLLVGKNATGKTRTLNIILALARVLTGKTKPFRLCEYEAEFEDGSDQYQYILHCRDGQVRKEELRKNNNLLLQRGEDGTGKIFAVQLDKQIDFQAPSNTVAAVARQDEIQHPFLTPMYQWASTVHHFSFGTDLGKHNLALFVDGGPKLDPFDATAVVGILRAGLKKHGTAFKSSIIEDMRLLNYHLEDIELQKPDSIQFETFPPGALDLSGLVWVHAKERDISGTVQQHEMSQGMFRALSLIIQLTYSALELKPSCILIDDIGEGLDFERSCALIKVLIEKAKNSGVQLLMSTNDRFVMNTVPLEMWAVLRREKSVVRVFNYENSKELFDEFSYTGLNNFDFLATDFIGSGGLRDEEDSHLR